jgi:hypothetical protein
MLEPPDRAVHQGLCHDRLVTPAEPKEEQLVSERERLGLGLGKKVDRNVVPSALETDVAPDDVGEQDDFLTAFDALSEGESLRAGCHSSLRRVPNGRRG